MFSLPRALLLPVARRDGLEVDITNETPGTQWSPEWSSGVGSQYFGGTLMSVADGGATLTYNFTGTAIRVYGTERTGSRSTRTHSSYTLDGATPQFHQESTSGPTSNMLFYSSPALEDTQHTLLIQNLASGGELHLDYFEVTGSMAQRIQQRSDPPPPPGQGPGNEQLQPAVIAALAIASMAVLMGFTLLFFLWRRQYIRERRGKSGKSKTYPKIQLQSPDDTQTAPFLNEQGRIEPYISEPPPPSQPSPSSHAPQTSPATTPVVMTVTPLRPQPSQEQVVTASSSRRDEKRLLPTGPVFTMESISRLNLGLEVNSRDHSVVGQTSEYESEAGAVPPHHEGRENDGGVSLLGSSETVNPKALHLPPDYRRFYP